jgi:hypothetical protein
VCPDGDSGTSWLGRIAGAVSDWWTRALGDRAVRVASADGRREERAGEEWWEEPTRPEETEPWAGPPGWGDEWARQEWAENVRAAIEESIAQRTEQRERLVDWLRDLSESVRDVEINGRNERRIREWIDGVIRSVEEAGRTARAHDEERLQRWMDGMIGRLGGDRLDPDARLELRRELIRAAQELRRLE